MNKKINIGYFHGVLPNCKYKHNEMFDYSLRKLNQIVKYVLECGYNVQIIQSIDCVVVWIDDGHFRQR